MLSKLAPRAVRQRLAIALAVASFLVTLTSTSAFGATTYSALCDGVNLRSGAGTTYAIKTSVKAGTLVSVVATVTGGSWSTSCAGKSASGSSWYRISAIGGKSVSTLYGTTYVYGATSLFKVVVNPTASPATASPGTSASPGPSATPPPPGPTTLGDSVTFYGRGYGHGIGLSQYGAYGRAAAGQDAATILAHYYPGTTFGTMTNAQVRVLVLQSWTAGPTTPLRLYGLGGTWTFDGIATAFPAGAQAQLIPKIVSSTSTTWRLVVLATDGVTKLYDAATTGNLRMRPATSSTVLRLYSKPSSYDRYRGVLRMMSSAATPTVSVINEVPMESYLRGVVPSEVSSAWPVETLKSQAIASRSYAEYHLHPTTGSYELYDDTRSQAYRGVLAEQSTTNSAISATAGVVLRYGTAMVNAQYHSTGGGATESNQFVYTSSTGAVTSSAVPYLQGSMDRAPDGTAYDKSSPYATWHTATYTLAQVQSFFAADSRTNVGTLVALDLSHRGVARLVSVILYGADGTTKTVSGAVFIAVFNAHRPSGSAAMRDTLFGLAPIP